MKVDLTIILIVLFCALLGATGQIFFKIASKNFSFNPILWFTNIPLIVGVFLYGLSAVLFVWSLKHGEISIIYPIFATTYIWVSIFAHFYLGESFSGLKIGGIFLIILGIFLIVK
ncbi:EamA family transporter [Candidatus Pacearchaeota archaeon]|nr:EamA family transporter [Candidatus Pacearchaeota archaeon]